MVQANDRGFAIAQLALRIRGYIGPVASMGVDQDTRTAYVRSEAMKMLRETDEIVDESVLGPAVRDAVEGLFEVLDAGPMGPDVLIGDLVYADVRLHLRTSEPGKGSVQLLFEWDDQSQLLVDIWATGGITAAKRDHPSAVWGPPAEGRMP